MDTLAIAAVGFKRDRDMLFRKWYYVDSQFRHESHHVSNAFKAATIADHNAGFINSYRSCETGQVVAKNL